MKRALLEIIASGVATTRQELETFVKCTLFHSENQFDIKYFDEILAEHKANDELKELKFVSTRLGYACLASSVPPNEGIFLFSELQKARQNFVLETDLHAVYLVTPFSVCNQLQEIDWMHFMDKWDDLSASMQHVGKLVGVSVAFIAEASTRGISTLDSHALKVHKR